MWAGVMDGLGLFMYATGSQIDVRIGRAVTELILPSRNATGEQSLDWEDKASD